MAKKNVNLDIPSQGFVFWPVGTGDSTTIAGTDGVFLQVDLRHMKSTDEEDDPHTPIVDRLVELLPQVNGKPYLPVFALTHPDEDHCLGFDDLLKRVNIGELWFTPRIFREYKKDLCDDAQAFRKEAKRRVKKTIQEKEDVASGDRVRIIGYDDLLKDEEYEGFPRERLTIPGNEILELDGEDQSDYFRAFVHAPFKDDAASERNDTSLALQVTLCQDDKSARALLLGDLCYPIIRQIFDRSKDEDLKWNVMLAPHHCSKSVMYWQDEGEDKESLKQGILDDMEKAADDPGYIVASSEPVPKSNKSGDNPPHAKAKRRYEEIAPDGFLCTQEHPNEQTPEPIVFLLDDDGFRYVQPGGDKAKSKNDLAEATKAARGGSEPPTERVGFGKYL